MREVASPVLWLKLVRKMVQRDWIKRMRNGSDTPSPTSA